MNPKEVREWYRANGMEYIPEDWGDRFDTGESADREGPDPRVLGREHLRVFLPGSFLEGSAPWSQSRSSEEREYMEVLEDFFQPYIAMLPRPKGELLRQMMNDQKTYAQIQEDEGRASRGSTVNAGKRALQALIRLIAQDDPEFVAPLDGRRRDYEAEATAARRVFSRYLTAWQTDEEEGSYDA